MFPINLASKASLIEKTARQLRRGHLAERRGHKEVTTDTW